jgi:hypothetical protein
MEIGNALTNYVSQLLFGLCITKRLHEKENVDDLRDYYKEIRPHVNTLLKTVTSSVDDYSNVLQHAGIHCSVLHFDTIKALLTHLSFEENAAGVIFREVGSDKWERVIGIIGHEFTTQQYYLYDVKSGFIVTCKNLDVEVAKYLNTTIGAIPNGTRVVYCAFAPPPPPPPKETPLPSPEAPLAVECESESQEVSLPESALKKRKAPAKPRKKPTPAPKSAVPPPATESDNK